MTAPHRSARDMRACYETRKPEGWVGRVPSAGTQDQARKFMLHDVDTADWPQGLVEAVIEWKLASDELEIAHHHISAGGGMELSDHVRELLRAETRTAKIAEMHRKATDEHGGTWGECAECGHAWPCPTYDWARGDSDRDTLSGWDRSDDSDSAP